MDIAVSAAPGAAGDLWTLRRPWNALQHLHGGYDLGRPYHTRFWT